MYKKQEKAPNKNEGGVFEGLVSDIFTGSIVLLAYS
jgi:hypothetical protein